MTIAACTPKFNSEIECLDNRYISTGEFLSFRSKDIHRVPTFGNALIIYNHGSVLCI